MSAHYPTDKGVAARVESFSANSFLSSEKTRQASPLTSSCKTCSARSIPTSPWCILEGHPDPPRRPRGTDTGVMWRMFTRDEGEPLQ